MINIISRLTVKEDIESLKMYIKELESKVEMLEQKNENLKEELKTISREPGRPSKLTKEEKENMRLDRWRGMTIRALGEKYRCSSTLAHRVVKDIKK